MSKLKYAPQIIAKQWRHLKKPRRTGLRVFGVGAAKTGTHTLAQMFEDHVRTGHEADADALIRRFLHKAETGDAAPLHKFLRWRDRLRGLKIDSSSVNAYLIDDLLTLYPDSRFLLTIRPPGPWLRSMLDHSVLRDPTDAWKRFRTYRFGTGDDFPPEEAELQKPGLFPVSRYLDAWTFSVSEALDKIPEDQLLILQTSEIGPRAREFAEFCGLGPEIAPKTTHAYANRFRSGLLDTLPRDYLAEKLEHHAGEVARRALSGWSADGDLEKVLTPAA